MHSDAFGHARTCLDMFGRVGMLVAFVLNAGEAGDEMCSPTSPACQNLRNVRSQACTEQPASPANIQEMEHRLYELR